jgi:hypothetical protein
MIQVTAGPYRNQRLAVSEADASSAISEGWAYDPFAVPPAEPPAEQTDEDRERIYQAAVAAAPRLRGEPVLDPRHKDKPREHEHEAKQQQPQPQPHAKPHTRDMVAEENAHYPTKGAPVRK